MSSAWIYSQGFQGGINWVVSSVVHWSGIHHDPVDGSISSSGQVAGSRDDIGRLFFGWGILSSCILRRRWARTRLHIHRGNTHSFPSCWIQIQLLSRNRLNESAERTDEMSIVVLVSVISGKSVASSLNQHEHEGQTVRSIDYLWYFWWASLSFGLVTCV